MSNAIKYTGEHTMDTLDTMAEWDEDGPKPTRDERRVILEDHGHCKILDAMDETIGKSWVEFYQWLGY